MKESGKQLKLGEVVATPTPEAKHRPIYDCRLDGPLNEGETILIYEDGSREKVKVGRID